MKKTMKNSKRLTLKKKAIATLTAKAITGGITGGILCYTSKYTCDFIDDICVDDIVSK